MADSSGCLSGTSTRTALPLSPNHHSALAQRRTLSPTRDTLPISPTAESSPVYALGGSGIHLYYPSPSLSAQVTPQPPSYESPCFTPAFIQPNPTWHNSCPPEKVPNSVRRGLEDLALPASPLLALAGCPASHWSPPFRVLLLCFTSDLLPDAQLSKGRTVCVLCVAGFPGHSTLQALDECLLNACMIDGGRAEIMFYVCIRRMPGMLLRT